MVQPVHSAHESQLVLYFYSTAVSFAKKDRSTSYQRVSARQGVRLKIYPCFHGSSPLCLSAPVLSLHTERDTERRRGYGTKHTQ